MSTFTNKDMLDYIDGNHVQTVQDWKDIVVQYGGDPDAILEADLPVEARKMVAMRKQMANSPYTPPAAQLASFRAAQRAVSAPAAPPTVLVQPTMAAAPTFLPPAPPTYADWTWGWLHENYADPKVILDAWLFGAPEYTGLYEHTTGTPMPKSWTNPAFVRREFGKQIGERWLEYDDDSGWRPPQAAAAPTSAPAQANAPQATTRQQIGNAAATGVQTAFNLSVALRQITALPGKALNAFWWLLAGMGLGGLIYWLVQTYVADALLRGIDAALGGQ